MTSQRPQILREHAYFLLIQQPFYYSTIASAAHSNGHTVSMMGDGVVVGVGM
jgi:hypothetical protein